jgi:hypothetical protein
VQPKNVTATVPEHLKPSTIPYITCQAKRHKNFNLQIQCKSAKRRKPDSPAVNVCTMETRHFTYPQGYANFSGEKINSGTSEK